MGVVRCLGKKLGADIDKATNDGSTPVGVAAQNGRLDLVRCMCKELRSDVDKAKNDGSTPVIIATCHRHLDVVRCLVKGAWGRRQRRNDHRPAPTDGGATVKTLSGDEVIAQDESRPSTSLPGA